MTPTTTDDAPAGKLPLVATSQGEVTDTPPADGAPVSASGRLRQLVHGTRGRLLLAYVLLLSISLGASLFLIREVLVAQLETRIESELRQEVQELQRLVGGNDPDTGRAFGTDVEAIFDTYIRRNVPNESEGLYAFVDGAPYLTSADPPAALTTDAELVASLRGLLQPRRGSLASDAGTAQYLAVPVRSVDPATGAPTSLGVFLVAEFPQAQLERLDDNIVRIGLALLGVLALGSVAAYAAAGRVLAPLRQAIETARSIQESNLSSRIQVRGSDDVAELGLTFNAMLDRLEQAVQSQRNFVSDAGHELRTPITIVRGHLELMTDDPDDRRETLALVTDELERMSRLVDDLLLLAKSERGDFLMCQPVHTASLLPAVLAKVPALAPRAWSLGETAEATVDGDPQRLTQAMTQLAQNATQHTQEGDSITLGCSVAGDWVRLWVKDEGEGVAAEDQARIFERFARAAAARRRSDGSGLGLSIVQAIAEAHGGRVELASVPGAGSTFALVLPVVTAPAPVR